MLSFILGAIFGLVVACTWIVVHTMGKLKIDHSNPEKDLYRLELDDLDKLSKKKIIVLKLDHKANLSQD